MNNGQETACGSVADGGGRAMTLPAPQIAGEATNSASADRLLTFDAVSHTYYYDGVPVPNVTRIIAPFTDYSRIPPDVLERARQQGVAVHKMAELYFKDDLGELPEWMVGYCEALLRFVVETGFECVAGERQLYSKRHGYAGTLDLVGRLTRLKNARALALLDIKRSFYAGAAIGLQTAAYADAWDEEHAKSERIEHRFALQLKENGSYRLEPFEDRGDRTAFLAALNVHRWREKHYGPSR